MDITEIDEFYLLQSTSSNHGNSEQGSSGNGLDDNPGTPELCCSCWLCIRRDDLIAESIVSDITLPGSGRTNSRGFHSYKET